MSEKQNQADEATQTEAELADPEDQAELAGDSAGAGEGAAPGAAVVEPPEGAVARLTEEVGTLKDQHLRLAAEYENFRKRTARERTETWSRAQADVVSNILDAIDDLGRVADLDPGAATSKDVIQGVELVERKLLKELEIAGLERLGAVGDTFDPNQHEAVGSLPADSESDDHTVGSVLQPGYKFGGALIRPARVQVRMWTGS